jgi:predicted ATPase
MSPRARRSSSPRKPVSEPASLRGSFRNSANGLGTRPPTTGDPEAERDGLFEAVVSLFAAASRARPLVLVLDDLQWAAKPTLLMLRHLLRSREPTRVLVIGTYRDTELDRSHPLAEMLANLRRDTVEVERLRLRGLDPSRARSHRVGSRQEGGC